VASLCHRLFLVHPKVRLLAGVNMAPVESLSVEGFFISSFTGRSYEWVVTLGSLDGPSFTTREERQRHG
jgi:hypothetical protein